ncbi:MAG: Epimerase family protein [Thermoleophilia bacterium]|nr:Epimerase family protein [Thermoleophilia bacterium]
MRILVSGAGGLIGAELVRTLRERGDEVGALVRGEPSGALDVRWDPAAGTIDRAALAEGRFDAVAHLAGETIAGRWTADKRRRIMDSRVNGTTLLAEAIAQLEQPPTALICASATGIYGDRGEELLVDGAAPGDGFLADVCVAWEAAAEPARAAGIRTAHLRMCAVQSPRGGALKAQLLPFKLGLGGPIAGGRQWAPWVGLTEAVRIWCFALDDDRVAGPINAIGPTPARNRDYVRALGRVLHRPTVLPTPTPLLRLAMGDVIDSLLVYSQKVVPSRLEGLGYEFLDRTIVQALEREIRGEPRGRDRARG